ncbi:hypothetical protein SAMD00019534_109850 [Acytostelium subglobosum LB1]|uniref:hypothetical protein n=1 Tax=Acytostelium subglobosum LB1 TaxID=1410327 RepID=UPI000644A47F|nr:hypothetical protein SAMD00019534_109850 [Acytostelium subglobosum LB1]GAM27809.1 hypothetical protein SAMD00019534_109850 [Acytostelium subglobosum LB1]|eukprot:XP_012749092.1 hypothetical protein SAMD00019534_109850 [Acytostelium subglobosum LB1]
MNESTFSVTTFNILAPCYNRTNHYASPEAIAARDHPVANNNNNNKLVDVIECSRQYDILQILQTVDADIINLQEFFFNKDFKQLYESTLSDRYQAFYLQRTSGKLDGVATFVKKHLNIKHQHMLEFKDQGDRVALILHIDSPSSSSSPSGHELILANTHLTFPHTVFDETILRRTQIESIHNNIQLYLNEIQQVGSIPIVICGDMNTPTKNEECVVNRFFRQKGYISTFNYIHPEINHFVSHKSHKDQEVGADYIYLLDSNNNSNNNNSDNKKNIHIQPIESYLFPKEVPADKWIKGFESSDHRPLTTSFRVVQ